MLPSAPTVSCHSLRSAPALTASSAGAAAAGLPRGRGTFASGGGMALRSHLATVAGLFGSVRPAFALWPVPLRVPCRGGLAVAGCVTLGGHRPGVRRRGCWCVRAWRPFRRLLPPGTGFTQAFTGVFHVPGWRCCRFRYRPAGCCRPSGCPSGRFLPPGDCRWTGAPSWWRAGGCPLSPRSPRLAFQPDPFPVSIPTG